MVVPVQYLLVCFPHLSQKLALLEAELLLPEFIKRKTNPLCIVANSLCIVTTSDVWVALGDSEIHPHQHFTAS